MLRDYLGDYKVDKEMGFELRYNAVEDADMRTVEFVPATTDGSFNSWFPVVSKPLKLGRGWHYLTVDSPDS